MPFDGKIEMTRLQKLERLRALLDEATDEEQLDCGRCLMARMGNDVILQAAGFKIDVMPTGIIWRNESIDRRMLWHAQLRAARDFLSTTSPAVSDGLGIFSAVSVAEKRALINALIVAEL